MKFKSPVYSSASGSIAGLTYSHNRGGLYTRARAIPVNSSTQFQQNVRNQVASMAARWNSVLTAAQRNAWETYALNTPMTDSLGDPRNIGGLAHYVRSNAIRAAFGQTIIDAGPTTYGLALLSTITAVGDVSDQDFDVTYVNTDVWAGAVGGKLFVFQSRPQNQSINYFKGPYRFLGVVSGAAVPPTPPAAMVAAFTFALTQKVFLYGRASNADGRLSAPFRISATIQA
jgi:hypothetical protein